MAKLKIPSLQHLSRNWKSDSGTIARDLVHLVRNPPIFNYNKVFSATYDLLHFKQPLDQVLKGIEEFEKRKNVKENFLELVPLISEHFSSINPDFVNPVSTRRYSFGKGLDVPFTPPLVYGVGGQLYFPWFSFWRANPLRGDNLSLFVTLVEEVLNEDPDFEGIKFQILDFSAPLPGEARRLIVTDASEVARLSRERKVSMLEIFADGYTKARAILEAEPKAAPEKEKSEDDRYSDDIQPDLFS